MNPKIKRRLNTYNGRFHVMGFEMRLDVNSDPSLGFDFTVTLIYDNAFIGEKEIMKLVSWPSKRKCSFWVYDGSINNLETPQPISDFLYYGMAILEEINKEFEANHNNGEGNGNNSD